MKLRFSLKKISVTKISLISFFLFSDLITIEYMQSPPYTLLQYISLMVVAVYAVPQIRRIKITDMMFLIASFIMTVCLVISSYLNHIDPALLRGSIYYAILIFIMCMFLIKVGNKGKIDEVLFGGKIYLLMVLVLNDFLMLIFPETFYNVSGRDIGTMFLGNKFSVSYAHLMLMFLLIYEEKNIQKRDRKVIMYAILTSILCLFVDCNTTLLACWVFVILYFFPDKLKMIASNPIVFIAVFSLSGFLLLLFSGILTWAPIHYLIVDILHRDATLTGRMQVYSYIYPIVFQSKWWGYGYYTDIFKQTSIWYANAQNAMWDFIVCYGFITMAAMFIYMMSSVCKYSKKNGIDRSKNINWLTYSMLYVYIFMGIGEITYNKQFFFYIALLWAGCSSKSIRERGRV